MPRSGNLIVADAQSRARTNDVLRGINAVDHGGYANYFDAGFSAPPGHPSFPSNPTPYPTPPPPPSISPRWWRPPPPVVAAAGGVGGGALGPPRCCRGRAGPRAAPPAHGDRPWHPFRSSASSGPDTGPFLPSSRAKSVLPRLFSLF